MIQVTEQRNELVEQNLGLVHACANRFRGKGVDYDDLFQSGCVGLIKAAENFDVELGFSFSTYAVPVILGEIRRIFRDGGSIKVGRALKERARAAKKEQDLLTAELDRDPSIGELAQRLGTDAAEASMLLNASMPVLSLTGGDEASGAQFDIPAPSHEVQISDTIALREVISSLDDNDRNIIILRYYNGLTQNKTAAKLGMSQVQVSRREKVILSQIRIKLTL